tara:strand:+ start:1090 stop:1686 length:597 start_codon:yes stop_codon:yes gene_type:complete
MPNKQIAWEKWDEDVIEQEIVENFHEEYEEDESGMAEDALLFLEKIPNLVTTPMGMYQLHDKMSILNQFECWMGYTNFDITHSIKDKIEKVEGVELLNITSRYRFFLGVGKFFDFSDVRLNVEKEICDRFEIDDTTEETVSIIKDSISMDKLWAIFVSEDGEILYTSTNDIDDEDYLTTLGLYEEEKDSNGGLIFQNE